MTRPPWSRIVAFSLIAATFVLSGWVYLHSEDGDPKNIKYVLWKTGLYKADLDFVTFTMLRDPNRNELVIGKGKEQLSQEFGRLLTLREASPYYQMGCSEYHRYSGYHQGEGVFFIKDSPWMIVSQDGKATDLVLMKGY
jgi:hypothetical protein